MHNYLNFHIWCDSQLSSGFVNNDDSQYLFVH